MFGIPMMIGGGGMPMMIGGGGMPMMIGGGGMPMMIGVPSGPRPVMVLGGGGMLLGGPPMMVMQQPRIECSRCFNAAGGTMGGVPYCDSCARQRLHGHTTNSSSSSSSSSRASRLESGPVRELYHQTDAACAALILDSQQFKRGDPNAACGSAIYFAETAAATQAKANRHGVVLVATVRLGRIKNVSQPEKLTFSELDNSGYDSVRLTCFNGDEYVVYNYDQVTNIRRA
jgi:hypothetical protein